MLPPSHIAYTLLTLTEIKKHTDYFEDADYRLVVLGALGPDLIDKPFSWIYFRKRYKSGRFFAHTLITHLAVLLYTLWKAPHHLVYALAFNGHAIADQMWDYKKTWYWPFRGRHFSGRCRGKGKSLGILTSYWHAFTKPSSLWDWAGYLALLWFIVRNRLWEPKRLSHLLRTGQLLSPRAESKRVGEPVHKTAI